MCKESAEQKHYYVVNYASADETENLRYAMQFTNYYSFGRPLIISHVPPAACCRPHPDIIVSYRLKAVPDG